MVTGRILSFVESTDGNKNILINIEYTLPDSRKVFNPYYAKLENFWNKTVQEITDWIKAQVEYQCENYLEDYVGKDFVQGQINNTISAVLLAYPGAIEPVIIKPPKTVLSFTPQKRSVENNKMITGTLNALIGLTFSRDRVVYKINPIGNLGREQHRAETAAQYGYVKQIEILENKQVMVKDI